MGPPRGCLVRDKEGTERWSNNNAKMKATHGASSGWYREATRQATSS